MSRPSDAVLDRLLALHPKIIDLVLDRVVRLLDDLGRPQDRLPPVVHIAGTNGKGSTLAMVRAGLEAAGLAVHAYTSPHLVRFHERIRLAGTLIAEDALAGLLAECERVNAGRPITFFEITTAAALLAFARTPADMALLEVGLGGRLDATNVVERPRLTMITPVSLDHQQYLGETVAEIAGEKAGILKPGVPCIVGPQVPAALAAIEDRAAKLGTPLRVHGRDWHTHMEHGRLVYQDDAGLLDLDPPRLIGTHQRINAGMAVAALRALGHGEAACQAAVRDAEWPARMQRLTRGPLAAILRPGSELWMDGGHNPAAAEALAAILDDWHAAGRDRPHLIVGMLATKVAGDYFAPLAPRAAGVTTVAIPGAAASFTAQDLAAVARSAGAQATAAPDLATAMAGAAADSRCVVICGSLYLAGHVLAENG